MKQQNSVPGQSCPNCGYGFTVGAAEWPCPKCGALVKQPADKLGPKDSSVAHSRSTDGITEEVFRVVEEGRSLAADLVKERIDLSLKAASRRGEEASPEVCRILVARLNREGGKWGQCNCQGEQDVDCTASDAKGTSLKIQITRAAGNDNIWRQIAKFGQANSSVTSKEAVDELKKSIARKGHDLTPAQRKELILALDAIETPGQITAQVIKSFRQQYGTWTKNLGFQAIWVVGPNEALTFRLDETDL